MDVEPKIKPNPTLNTSTSSLKTQICLKFLATVSSLPALCIIFTSKQTIMLYGLQIDAKYSDDSSFKFLAAANVIVCVFSVVSLFVAVVLARKCSDSNNYFYMLLHDLVVMLVMISGCAAASAIGKVSQYGNTHTGWLPICDHFARFCHRSTVAVELIIKIEPHSGQPLKKGLKKRAQGEDPDSLLSSSLTSLSLFICFSQSSLPTT